MSEAVHEATHDEAIVIVGGGHAGIALCGALVAGGCRQPVHLVCAEAELPYQRPPLSKDFIKNPEAAAQLHRSEAWLAQQGIHVHRGDAAVAIERERRVLRLAFGRELPYGRLVLATGARARELPGLSPGALANVATLRTAEDARRLRTLIAGCEHLIVLGGGFIGLEVAASARALGKQVTVLEAAPRLLARSVSPALAEHLLQAHRANGIEIRLGVRVDAPRTDGNRLLSLDVDGQTQAVDVLLLGIGAMPDIALAQAAGLACDNGIVVDAHMQSSDPAILAIGDCCAFARNGVQLRLESVQNASDQARAAAAALLGDPKGYAALPWFWSEQGGLRVQIAGLVPSDAKMHRRPGGTPESFSLLHYVDGRLAAVESVNAAPDHIGARKLLDKGVSPDPAMACDPARTLASLLPA